MATLIALPCTISRGIVSDKRAFKIALDGVVYFSAAPAHYFWTQDGRRLSADEPPGDKEIPGKIAGRLLEQWDKTALVSLPNGVAVLVHADSVVPRPSEVVIEVSEEKGESHES